MSERQEPQFDAPPADPAAAAARVAAAEALAFDLEDALLQAVLWVTRHHGRERSAASLLAGIPVQGALGPDQAVRALGEAGFNAGLIRRPVGLLHPLLLPAVLLLKNGDACIVVARQPGAKGEPTRYDVVMPGPEALSCQATEAELAAEYTGIALVASPKPQAVGAVKEELLLDPRRHWLWGTLRRFAPYYRASLLAALLSNVLMLGTGLVSSVVFDKVIPHKAFVTLWALASGALLAIGFDLVARHLRHHLIDLAGRKADLIIGSMLFRQTLNVRMEHRPESAGAFAHQLAQIEVVREFFAGATLSALSDLPFIVIFVAMTFVVGGSLGWVLVLGIPIILAMTVIVQGALRRAMRTNLASQADLHGTLVEAVEGMEDLKAAGAQGRFLHRYEDATATSAESSLRSRALSGWTHNLAMAAQQVITIVMLVWGVYLIADGKGSAGALIGAVMFAGRAVAPLSSVVALATRYQGARAAMVNLERLMKLPTEREHGRAYIAPPQIQGQLSLHDVAFAYPPVGQNAAPQVLKGVNLMVQPGERIAVLGRIGSGKSTVLRLLAGLYQPSGGMVAVDGIDLRQIDIADYRAKVGFVSQEPRLFNGSLRENVLLGRSTVNASRLAEVARLTGLDRLTNSHPQGWELPVGEAGGLLSGGQRQLVALARSLVTQPQILLMDEPTSSMDAQSEMAFLKQLAGAIGRRTLIMVTHRPAVLALVERIIVVDQGRIVMDGPKAQVLAALSGQAPPQQPAPAEPELRAA